MAKVAHHMRTIAGGYAQDREGAWWILSPQTGWVRVPNDSRALDRYRALALRHRLVKEEI